ncbi:MAG: type II secretion system protein [Gemmatimonadaceae bacterium]|nr:type II secretion system protein [Gemmatimonadaceae bacterium]
MRSCLCSERLVHTQYRTPAGRLQPRRGHTVVEMLIVMSLMAALAGIAMPRLNYSAMRLDANVRVVRSAFQQAWRAAIQTQHDMLVSMDTAAKRIRIVEDVNNDGLPSPGERVTWRPLEEGAVFDVPAAGVSGPVTTSVSGPGVKSVQGMPTITFRRNGSTSGDVELYLSIRYRSVKEFRGVTVAQATGRTEWFRRVNGSWWRSGGI